MKTLQTTLIICVLLLSYMLYGCSKEEKDIAKLEPLNQREYVVMATNAGRQPFEFKEEGDGVVKNLSGIDVEVGALIAKDLAKELRVNDVIIQSAIVGPAVEKADFSISTGVFETEENKECLEFSDSFYTSKPVVLVNETSPIKGYTSFKDAVVGVVKNYKEGVYVADYKKEGNLALKEYDKASGAVADLIDKKLDAVIIEHLPAYAYMDDNQDKGLRVVEIPELFPEDRYVVAVKKGNQDLLNKINAFIKRAIDNNSIEQIILKYYD